MNRMMIVSLPAILAVAGCRGADSGAANMDEQLDSGAPDGAAANGDEGDAGLGSCSIGAAAHPTGDQDPKNACQVCDPATSVNSWSPRANGEVCGTGLVCVSSICQNGCWIDSAFYSARAAKPHDPCHSCQPELSSSSWSAVADGQSCNHGVCRLGTCESACWISGAYYQGGAKNPANTCQICQPEVSRTEWRALADGSECGAGLICSAGVCGSGCYIDNSRHMSGDLNPANNCQSCQPEASVGSWTRLSDGDGCGNGRLCHSAQCLDGCWIGNTFYDVEEVSSDNQCQSCQPVKSTAGWSGRPDGTGCGSGMVCSAMTCKQGCWIGSKYYAADASNPKDVCKTCQSARSATDWSVLSDGASCGSGRVCSGGTCIAGCVIDGKFYVDGAQNPSDPCRSCLSAISTKSWSNSASGTSCGAGKMCVDGVCQNGCWIGGAYYPDNTSLTSNICAACVASKSTRSWTGVNSGQSCGSGAIANGAWTCSDGRCALSCSGGYGPCGNGCFDVKSDDYLCCYVTCPRGSSCEGGECIDY